jgi:hypothetical protein
MDHPLNFAAAGAAICADPRCRVDFLNGIGATLYFT